MDRIEDGTPAGGRFEPRTIPGGDAAEFVIAGITGRLWRHTAQVRLRAAAAEVAPHLPAASATLVSEDEQSCLLTLGGDSVRHLARDICGLGVDFEIEDGPDGLPAELQAIARRVRRST